ncbi:MAG: adenylate kinase [Candidatus Saccharibacteria bacterium]|nr:adenylate kinase [Candidatus Saccharibacteria bacterium]
MVRDELYYNLLMLACAQKLYIFCGMANPEIILLGGAPGSGKSTIGKRVVKKNFPEGVRHLAIGDLKRDIVAGKVPSAYAEMLQQREHPDRKTGAAPSEAMTGIMEEFILARPGGLTIVDGFPRYMDRVKPFQESMQRIGAEVLALVTVEVPEVVLIERLTDRPTRPGQKIQDPLERLADHRDNIVPTLEALAVDYEHHELDGTLPIDFNADYLGRIYTYHRF